MTTAFDPERLLAWQVPERIHDFTRRDTALYALSIGFGHDPVEHGALRFVDPTAEDFVAFPTMALVLGYPGFWLGQPGLGINAAAVLHADQDIELFRPLPVEGRVTGVTHIESLVDRGIDRGALLQSRREIFDSNGIMVACVRQSHVLRGHGGFGGDAAAPARPARPEWTGADCTLDTAIRPEQALLYRLNGDMNPVHSDPAVARAAGFDRPLLHGMCTLAIAARAVARHVCPEDPARLTKLYARFTSPVFPGETLRTEVSGEGLFRARIVERETIVLDFGASAVSAPRHQGAV